MRGFFFLIMLLLGLGAHSQKLDSAGQSEVLMSIDEMDFSNHFKKVLDTCNKYLGYETNNCQFRASLYYFKTKALESRLDSLWSSDEYLYDDNGTNTLEKDIEQKIVYLYDSAINKCKTCELYYLMKKYYFLTEAQNFEVNQKEMVELKVNGFKPEQQFLAFSPTYYYSGKNQWIGGEISIQLYQPKFKLGNVDSSMMLVWSPINFGFRKNISTENGWGINFSLCSGSYNWINVRPINFSYLNNGENKSWGYSPEVGFQFWYLHLNVGYNVVYKKSMRDYERLYFTAKFDIPFYRYEEN